MFNSISDSVIGDEENFVAAIEYEPGKDYAGAVGHANRIRVENRKEKKRISNTLIRSQ